MQTPNSKSAARLRDKRRMQRPEPRRPGFAIVQEIGFVEFSKEGSSLTPIEAAFQVLGEHFAQTGNTGTFNFPNGELTVSVTIEETTPLQRERP